MKHLQIILMAILVLAAHAAAQEYRGVTFEVVVDNGAGREQVLALGLREGATSGLDPMLEEAELPPQPPAEIFDARVVSTPGTSQLGTGSLSDYRSYGSGTSLVEETYTVAYQAGIGATGVTLRWADPLPGRVRKVLIDGVDQSGATSYESQFAQGQMTIAITFDPSPLGYAATPNPLLFDANNREPLPSRTLTITPQGDAGAGWSLTTDVDWISVEPTGGEGETEVHVGINTSMLPAGEYEGTIFIRSEDEPARLDVPVLLRMTVGVEDVHVPGQLYLGENYPNPFGGAASADTRVEVDLGSAAGVPSLRVHDMMGREVMDLTPRLQDRSGLQVLRIDAHALPAGMYTVTLRRADMARTRTMIVTR
ncbi:MAG: T9SS type A sorting domain-containing protein [Bacteroidota bacterium]|jgi:hypothetical protein|nr:T9SS type A sorting domain-containing protein [Bacteroidota bacterium]